MKHKYIIVYLAFIVALTVGEMVIGNLQTLYTVRFLYPLLFLSTLTGGFKVMKNIGLYLTAVLLFCIPSLMSLDNPVVTPDLVHIVWWTLFMFILNYFLKTEACLKVFLFYLLRFTFLLTFVGAVLGLYKLYLYVNGNVFESMKRIDEYGFEIIINGSSLNIDYNVYSFAVFFGIIAGWNIYLKQEKALHKIFISIALLIMFISAMVSSSRRGLVLAVILLIILTFFRFPKSKIILKDKPASKVPWFTLIVFLSILYFLPKIDFVQISNQYSEIGLVFNRLETVSDINSRDYNTRTPRWIFAMNYFYEQPLINQLFGSGFEYTSLIGTVFRETHYDHPHNVYLSALLYSGVLGFIIVIFLTINTFFLYYANREYIGFFGIWFLLMFILSLTSSNSIFSGRAPIILFLMPYLGIFKKLRVAK